jgi:hypothetical protein
MLIISILVILTIVNIVVTRDAYHNGVRDGYQNTFLPRVREQVQQEGLAQGEEIALP